MTEKYDAKTAELTWLKHWEDNKIFSFNPNAKGKVYSIDTPPPTVSGKMHIGHAFSYTQQDIIARYKRLKGFNVFYPFGTDDNGLPTERLVEKTKNVKGARMERQEFITLCEQTLKEIRPGFVNDWKRIGSSCDFQLFYSTIDKNCQKISQEGFLDLVKKERAYRKEAPSLWCPQCATAISQVECKDAEKPSSFNEIVFMAEGKELIIATTRPEMLSACVAIFAHPEDNRYKKLFGKKATVPLYDFEIPIMPDTKANPEKGTGIVMCCTFGDQTDMEWYRQYNLPLKEAITRDGKMTAIAGKYSGMRTDDARKQIIQELKDAGLLRAQTQITHAVNVHERCNTPIEIIQSKQWFIKYLDLKEDMLKWGAELTWHPAFMKSRYDNWVKGLQWDWLISRQRFFGIPFPVWYCTKCDTPIFADPKKLPIDPLKDFPPAKKCSCGNTEFIPEKDVLDTWATSSLTPKLASTLLDKKDQHKVYPMSLRPQAHDIITFWLFNTMVRSRLHDGINPWKEAVISGFVTMQGEKMSKSKGNVIEPQEVIAKYGADALRYWASSSKFGDDLDYHEKDVRTGDKFVTKLWNAANFANLNLQGYTTGTATHATDKWILHKLRNTIQAAEESFDAYDYAHAKAALEKFFWQDFCDNYLELIKVRMYEPKDPQDKQSAQAALSTCLSALLRLWAPFTPFITEELYQTLLKEKEGYASVHIAPWPVVKIKEDKKIEVAGELAVEILAAARKKKSEAKLSMKAPIKKITVFAPKNDHWNLSQEIQPFLADLKAATSAETIQFEDATAEKRIEVEM